jgi:uncharacterized SAM-binding protein YcdF (DUF218 family)
LILVFVCATFGFLAALGSWIQWGDWPESGRFGKVDAPALIVVLGGGDGARVRESLRIAKEFPQTQLLVTGDSGFIRNGLRAGGLAGSRILIEPAATSTCENALLSKPWIDAAGDGQVVLVTNDFHGPRARAVFRKVYPERRIVVACESSAPPYNQWQQAFRRRERAAAVYYVLRHGVCSW